MGRGELIHRRHNWKAVTFPFGKYLGNNWKIFVDYLGIFYEMGGELGGAALINRRHN